MTVSKRGCETRLDRSAQQRIIEAAELLKKEPRPSSARRLAVSSEFWRVRIGDYRIVYAIDGQKLLVLVVRVGHRGIVYRGIGDL